MRDICAVITTQAVQPEIVECVIQHNMCVRASIAEGADRCPSKSLRRPREGSLWKLNSSESCEEDRNVTFHLHVKELIIDSWVEVLQIHAVRRNYAPFQC